MGEIFKSTFALNIDYCVFTIHRMFRLRTRQIIFEQLSYPLLLLIFKFKSLFRERQQIALIFNEILSEVFYLIAC